MFQKKYWIKRGAAALCAALIALGCAGCASNPPNEVPRQKETLPSGEDTPPPMLANGDPNAAPDGAEKPVDSRVKLPAKLSMEGGEPSLKVYVVSAKKVEAMPLEKYLEGVLAGEMKNDWPLEALKAQAILARTFVLKFIEEKESKYPGADISTDIEEAQAYDTAGVNDRIREAVKETKGLVLASQGDLPYGWFHAHSGGLTAKAKEGLEYERAEPRYTKIVKGRESDKAPKDVAKWTATFTAAEVLKAASRAGVSGSKLEGIQIGQRGESGRATTLVVNNTSVPAGSFRIAIGSTKMKSTLLDEIKMEGGKVTFSGKGYGHGVGMSQWGAYGLAEQGEKAETIVQYYFDGCEVVRLW